MKEELRTVQIVVCTDLNGAIGDEGNLIYKFDEDLRRFARITADTVLVMGRKTFESLPRVLPNRKHVVISSKTFDQINWPSQAKEGQVHIASSFAAAMDMAKEIDSERGISIVGGGEVYQQALDSGLVNVVQATIVTNVNYRPHDTTFPVDMIIFPDNHGFERVDSGHEMETDNGMRYVFAVYHREGFGLSGKREALLAEFGDFIKIRQSFDNPSSIRVRKDMIVSYGPNGDLIVAIMLATEASISVRCESPEERQTLLELLDSVFLPAVLP